MHKKGTLLLLSFPAAILAGICLGAVAAGRSGGYDLFSTARESLASSTLCVDSLKKALWQNGITACFLFVFGTTLLGVLPSAFLVGFRGYALGNAVGALVSTFGFRGFLAAVCGVFPHNLLYIPFLCALGILGARFSARLRGTREKRPLLSYCLTSLFLSLPILAGCMVESFICAPLLRAILSPCL